MTRNEVDNNNNNKNNKYQRQQKKEKKNKNFSAFNLLPWKWQLTVSNIFSFRSHGIKWEFCFLFGFINYPGFLSLHAAPFIALMFLFFFVSGTHLSWKSFKQARIHILLQSRLVRAGAARNKGKEAIVLIYFDVSKSSLTISHTRWQCKQKLKSLFGVVSSFLPLPLMLLVVVLVLLFTFFLLKMIACYGRTNTRAHRKKERMKENEGKQERRSMRTGDRNR